MRRLLPAALLTGALVLAAPLAASAHVHVDPEQATAGEATDLAFSVPNEVDSARTTGVRITLPASLGDLEPQSIAGWTARTDGSGTTRAVEYRATGDGIGQGATQRFIVRVGDVPAVGSVLLPVEQTYSDGQVVRWDEPTPASGEEPEHPAPTLYVQDSPPAEHDDHGGGDGEDAAQAEAAPASADLALPTGLSVAALVVALGALVIGVLALLHRRR
ncbi:YcnI family protein [Amnibacterium endophyticum]|uniref:YcnI family protein n=1 Tax=Amnibacterium endophyticum TaxID=2109337 RepID=A0ABW4LI81_9MICO